MFYRFLYNKWVRTDPAQLKQKALPVTTWFQSFCWRNIFMRVCKLRHLDSTSSIRPLGPSSCFLLRMSDRSHSKYSYNLYAFSCVSIFLPWKNVSVRMRYEQLLAARITYPWRNCRDAEHHPSTRKNPCSSGHFFSFPPRQWQCHAVDPWFSFRTMPQPIQVSICIITMVYDLYTYRKIISVNLAPIISLA